MNPDPIAIALITLGAVFLAGLAADYVGHRTRLPRVTLLLLLGVCVGPLGFDLFPASATAWFPFVADLALVMVAFLLGGELTLSLLRSHGRAVLVISLMVVAVTAMTVGAGLLALGWPVSVALLLAAISTSTDPAAVSDVVRQTRARGPFTKTLIGVVAVDDAWGIAAMSLALAFVLGLDSPEAARVVALDGFIELMGAVLVGCALGIPMALLTGRLRIGEPTQAEALGGVLLCGGVALLLDVSFLLAAMTMGVVVANLARHHRRPFRAIEGIEWPFMILFFVLSGTSLQVEEFGAAAGLTFAYVILRVLGRVLGGWLGSRFSEPSPHNREVGVALLPQAGIAIGMALVVSQRVPDVGGVILTATVAGTIVFEIVGPILTRLVLTRSGESHEESDSERSSEFQADESD
jgi:Kef-type K+ transport system membrane component KefB